MAIVLQVIGGIGLLWTIVGAPNIRTGHEWLQEYTAFGIPIIIAGVGFLMRRLDRMEKLLEQANQRKPS